MDLRYEFDEILAQYGSNCLLVRDEQKLRCSCWNEKTQEAERDCPVCFGLGWTAFVEKHTVRSQDTSVPESLAFLGQGVSLGEMAVPGRQYYMRYNASVSPGDLIVEVEWSDSGKPLWTGKGIYEVSHVSDQRFERGEIVFKVVYCKDQPVEKQVRGVRIVNANGIKNYEILRG